MLLLCIKVFLARILDVSLGTVRTVFTVKNKKLYASLIGFFEVLIWFLIVKEALSSNESGIYIALSYSLGFATGTYIGGFLADTLINENITMQVFTDEPKLEKIIRENGYAVSTIECKGYDKEISKQMLYINVNKKKERTLKKLIYKNDKDAFIIVNETKYVVNGYFK
jgi:uncharacterized protein YebE (UPF0316 family)